PLSWALPAVLVMRYLVLRAFVGQPLRLSTRRAVDDEVQPERLSYESTSSLRDDAGASTPGTGANAATERRPKPPHTSYPMPHTPSFPERAKDAFLSVISELLQPLHWLHATLRHTI